MATIYRLGICIGCGRFRRLHGGDQHAACMDCLGAWISWLMRLTQRMRRDPEFAKRTFSAIPPEWRGRLAVALKKPAKP